MESQFTVSARVYIDGCHNLVGTVTAVIWRHPEIVNYEVSWMANGDSKCAVIEGWRLSAADE